MRRVFRFGRDEPDDKVDWDEPTEADDDEEYHQYADEGHVPVDVCGKSRSHSAEERTLGVAVETAHLAARCAALLPGFLCLGIAVAKFVGFAEYGDDGLHVGRVYDIAPVAHTFGEEFRDAGFYVVHYFRAFLRGEVLPHVGKVSAQHLVSVFVNVEYHPIQIDGQGFVHRSICFLCRLLYWVAQSGALRRF